MILINVIMNHQYLCKMIKYSHGLYNQNFNTSLKYCNCYHICQLKTKKVIIDNEKKFFECIPSMRYQKYLFFKADFKM